MAKTSNKRIVGVKSSTIAMFEGVFAGIIGLGVAILFSLRTTVDYTQETDSVLAGLTLGIGAGIVSILIVPLIYFAIGWVIGYIHGFIFNVVAESSDGIVIKMQDE